jgi:UDPglucose--hexose-1-phosphate uridylyltransferase
MMPMQASLEIEKLLKFGLKHKLIESEDVIPSRNALMDLLKINEPYDGEVEESTEDSPHDILENLLNYAVNQGMIENTVTMRDLFDTKMMGILMPRQSEVIKRFWDTARCEGIKSATDQFYRLSIDSNYIRMDRINKNLYWQVETGYGPIEITINLSKPEKDPKEIAAARKMPQMNYPKCLLCLENVGYAGNMNHPARQNHRVIPLNLNGEQWYLQYSPYVYYNEHCIVFYREHIPMHISEKTFARLFDFIEQFPHYFIGSNADLPIVGGSILNHEHFQGGRHEFPMEKAAIEERFIHPKYPNVKAGIVKWPLSTLRLSGDKDELIKLSSDILKAWREYSDPDADILSYTDNGKERIPHNTITPIARKNKASKFEMDLVFRNNRTTDKYPEGIFHPHRELHHIKKENIGLIEVMGLAVLPGRLNSELVKIEGILKGAEISSEYYDEKNPLYKHMPWIKDMISKYGRSLTDEEASSVIKEEVGHKFLDVLLDSGVFKRNEKGKNAFRKFIHKLGFITAD